MTGVLPYVPDAAFGFLPRDVQRFEPPRALLGGPTGLAFVSTVVRRSPRWIKAGGWLLLEVGIDQIADTTAILSASDFTEIDALHDGDGDPCGVYGRLGP
jgi:release factor glutamine methyltransferase